MVNIEFNYAERFIEILGVILSESKNIIIKLLDNNKFIIAGDDFGFTYSDWESYEEKGNSNRRGLGESGAGCRSANEWFLKDKAQVGHDALRKKLKYIIPSEKRKINYSTKEMFINNLKKLTEYSKSQNSIPIFVTQRTRRWHKENNIVYSVSKVDFYKYEKEVSETILFFCEKNKLFCVDLNGILDLEENDTYDRIHLTTTGAEKVAEKIFNNIKNYIYTNMIN